MKQSFFTLGAAFALAGVSQAAVLVDNFDSYPADNSTSMNGLGTWTVSNGTYLGLENAITTNSTFNGPGGAALIGGLSANGLTGATTLSSAATVALFDTAYPPARFAMDFGIYANLDGSTTDSYTISLGSNSGNLLTINLTPVGINLYNINFTSDFFASVNGGPLDTLDVGPPYPYFQVMLQTWTDGIGGMFYSLEDLNSGVLSSGSLSGTSLSDSTTGLSISVDNAGGEGFLIVDNVSVVPEPSSALLGLLGAAMALTRRRRA